MKQHLSDAVRVTSSQTPLLNKKKYLLITTKRFVRGIVKNKKNKAFGGMKSRPKAGDEEEEDL
ncbi:hypothetical protein J6590_057965 [Homalodisca vitripennis]|nr:hypothetical protein J6590_057965 [Homalodisca vitripennis]